MFLRSVISGLVGLFTAFVRRPLWATLLAGRAGTTYKHEHRSTRPYLDQT